LPNQLDILIHYL